MKKYIDKKYDLTVVGGGIIGLFVALCAISKKLKILLIDKGLIGNGASFYSLGLFRNHDYNKEKFELTKQSFTYWRNLLEQSEIGKNIIEKRNCITFGLDKRKFRIFRNHIN